MFSLRRSLSKTQRIVRQHAIASNPFLSSHYSIPLVCKTFFSLDTKPTPYWQSVPRWKDVKTEDFLNYRWQVTNSIQSEHQLLDFLASVLPPTRDEANSLQVGEFVQDVQRGLSQAPMSIRITPHILSVIDWTRPREDRIRKQFIPLGSMTEADHPQAQIDPQHEASDSPVKGVVHRYPEKALFLASSVCPVYCRFCTRSYSVGVDTETVSKTRFLPILKKWERMFHYIETKPSLRDVLVSGGDAYSLEPSQVALIGNRLLSIPHIRRIRFASKGLAVCPSRLLDPSDAWAETLIQLSTQGKKQGKSVSLHTHFNHPKEITWVTAVAAQKLFENGVTVRNQTVLLNGINNDLDTMQELIRRLADINIQPYYVYQGDILPGLEDLRTPLYEILELERQIRGTIAGFMTPSFILDLPGGGGKRLVNSYDSYDRASGVSRFRAPGVKGPDMVFKYHDPVRCRPT